MAEEEHTRLSETSDVETEIRSWCDLPGDILSTIKSRLFLRDAFIFSFVCKSWQSISPIPSQIRMVEPWKTSSQIVSEFPLLLFRGRNSSSICSFYHLVNNTTYTLDVPELCNATIRHSKNGWLLVSKGRYELFFLNPFTRQHIAVPPLENPYYYHYHAVSFSSTPTSPDCVILGISTHPDNNELRFSCISRGRTRWKMFPEKNDGGFIVSYCNPVFHDGLFYCLGKDGNLATFDLEKENKTGQGWTFLPSPTKPCVSIKRNYLVECNGNLYSVFQGKSSELKGREVKEYIKIFKLNQSMCWRRVDSLGDDMLFVSGTTSLSARSKEKETKGMENKVYFPRFRDNNCVFYSLMSGKFHCFSGIDHSSNNFYNTTEKLHCSWMEPNYELYTDQELQWSYNPTSSDSDSNSDFDSDSDSNEED